MKIALTIWGNRISPVFESASNLMVIHVEKGKIVSRCYDHFDPTVIGHAIAILHKLKIDLLICGAIIENQEILIEQNGIMLIPFISGNTEKIIASFIVKKNRISDYLMPGVIFNKSVDNFF